MAMDGKLEGCSWNRENERERETKIEKQEEDQY